MERLAALFVPKKEFSARDLPNCGAVSTPNGAASWGG